MASYPKGLTVERTVQQAEDEKWMRRAIELGQQARCWAAPNPWVGCVLVKEGRVISEGCTQPPGQAHAEAQALASAGARARGATVYVTLEPCSHHGRTAPCADALIAAGVARVVVAIEDPDPLVAGKGIARLRDAGIAVDVGVAQNAVADLLKVYLHHRRTGRPYCLAKVASSIDGWTAAVDGSSQWISGTEAREDVQRLRAESQAIVVGSGTALADRPRLTVRTFEVAQQPLRVVVDRRGRVPAEGPLFDRSLAPTLVATTEESSLAIREAWEDAGADVVVLGRELFFHDLLKCLSARGVLQVMVEGGAHLLGALLRESIIDELTLYVGPKLLGGGLPLFEGLSIANISEAFSFSLRDVTRFGETVRLDYTA